MAAVIRKRLIIILAPPSLDDLPVDIIQTILLNLPVKSLLRLKTVSKTWNDIISDRGFAKIHHQKSKNAQDLFLCTPEKEPGFCLFVHGKNRRFWYDHLPQQPPCGDVLCYGDGLVLLSSKDKEEEEEYKSYILWNPSNRKQKKFLCSTVIRSCANDHRGTHFGFCHDPDLDDYKVVIRYDKTYYAVFSCRNKSWTTKKNQEEETYDRLYPEAGLLVDGFTFWILRDTNNSQTKDIMYFDPRDDMFKKLKKKPEGVSLKFSLTSLRDCLCAYENMITKEGSHIRLRIWKMNGHVDICSWSQLMNIVMVTPPFDRIHMVWPMFLLEKNTILLCLDRQGYRFCDLKKISFDILTVAAFRICRDFPMVPYQDSLFFPIQDDEDR